MFERIKKAFGGVVQDIHAGAEARANLHRYEEEATLIFSNYSPSPAQLAALADMRRRYNLNLKVAEAAHLRVLENLALKVTHQVDRRSLDGLQQASNLLGCSLSALPNHITAELHSAAIVVRIGEGSPPIMNPSTTVIRPAAGEQVHLELQCSLLDEHKWHEYVGRSRGISVRIAKGVRYHVGASRGHTVTHTEVVPVDNGTLAITSKRIAFIGSRQNFNKPWTKLLHAQPMSDGLAISFTDRKKAVAIHYRQKNNAEVVAALLNHYVSR